MTTERKAAGGRRPAPVFGLSPLELRLWLTAGLAGGYALVWLALSPSTSPVAVSASLEPVPSVPAPRVAWIAELPPEQRPVVVLPSGWTLDTEQPRATAAAVGRQAPRVVRVSRARTNSVRTRSS